MSSLGKRYKLGPIDIKRALVNAVFAQAKEAGERVLPRGYVNATISVDPVTDRIVAAEVWCTKHAMVDDDPQFAVTVGERRK